MKTLLFEKYVESDRVTMSELAELLGYTPEYLSRIRHGHVPIKEQFIARVCLRLGCLPGELFFDDADEASEGPSAPIPSGVPAKEER